jgi:hypothetical protein
MTSAVATNRNCRSSDGATSSNCWPHLEDLPVQSLVLVTEQVNDRPEQHLLVAVNPHQGAVLGQRHRQGVEVAHIHSDCTHKKRSAQQEPTYAVSQVCWECEHSRQPACSSVNSAACLLRFLASCCCVPTNKPATFPAAAVSPQTSQQPLSGVMCGTANTCVPLTLLVGAHVKVKLGSWLL